ncbi:hypothetical protein IAU60_004083 [Kwoniella sp. DSM 27419]
MPKPTFLQAVLKKPTRSYADPYYASPWADHESERETYQPYHSSRYDSDYAGPSRARPRAPASTVSTSAMSDIPHMGTRFPKAARRVVSNVTLRDGQIVHLDAHGRTVDAPTAKPRKKKDRLATIASEEGYSRPGSSASGTIKKKKKKPQASVTDAASVMSSPASTVLSLPHPPPIHSRYSETSSSAASSAELPRSPAIPSLPDRHVGALAPAKGRPGAAVLQKALLTPPGSEASTPASSFQLAAPVIKKEIKASQTPVIQVSSPSPVKPETKEPEPDHEDAFFTPRSSLEDSQTASSATQSTVTLAAIPEPPTLNLLPPTPAPVPDPDSSPFHSEPSSSASSSLHPDRPAQTRPSPTIRIPSDLDVEGDFTVSPEDDADAQSASGEVGSDVEEGSDRGRHSRRNSESQPVRPSRDWSRPSSMVGRSTPAASIDGYRPPSEYLAARRPSQPMSEASFGSAALREGSIRGSISGYGKGGWAAAHSHRSRPSSPSMFMPTNGDGWADFQPPRQSKFTPLPTASHRPSFDKITNGSRLDGGSSAPASRDGRLRPPSRDSSPSEYSQISDGLPQPSRSYITKDYASEASQSGAVSDGEDEEATPPTEYSATVPAPGLGDLAFPIARVGSLSIGNRGGPGSTASRAMSQATSRPMSLVPGFSRPMSPVQGFSRPTSPTVDDMGPSARPSFNPPSFLNPDILTILPEMTPEDSERLYQPPPPSESGRSRRSIQDWSGYNPARRSLTVRTRSEAGNHGLEDQDAVGDLRGPPRSRSVMGFRNDRNDQESRWGGSSYGDGVLMESNGRAAESAGGGYTNLILPAGAYRPINPTKTRPDVDSRILGIPHATMAAIALTTHASRHSSTPAHLRDQLPSLVDFTSHIKPPTKVGDAQLLVQVYAVAIDQLDVSALATKGRGDVGKWIPGRSFVGRTLAVGADEKEVVRGDIVIGIVDLRKSGSLCEYILVDRRRVSRAPYPTQLSLEQLSILPLQGIPAARAVRTHLVRHSRAFIMDAHRGVAALICQEMSRAGVHVTAVIPGGDDSHEAHRACLYNGAKGVLMGSPAAVMLNMEEGAWSFVFDTVGGQRVYDAAKRMLKDGGKLVSTVRPESAFTSAPPGLSSRPSGLKTLRAAFGGKRKESKFIAFEYRAPAGSGEAEVDTAGMDYRDVMEEPCMAIFRPALPESIPTTHRGMDISQEAEVASVVHFERGAEVFKSDWEGVRVIRVIN